MFQSNQKLKTFSNNFSLFGVFDKKSFKVLWTECAYVENNKKKLLICLISHLINRCIVYAYTLKSID